jgi:murein DD-endopeptidase MepM/ murein hydrolase activator NlpD
MALQIPLAATAALPRRYFLSRGYFSSHPALDMVGQLGQPVLAAESGIVFASSWEGDGWAFGGGNVVLVDHYGPGKRRTKSAYCHLKSRAVSKGQYVMKGQVIGWADNTGNSFGSHLHFGFAECKIGANPALYYSYVWQDPRLYFPAHTYHNGSQGRGARWASEYVRNTVLVKPNCNMRSGPSTKYAIKRTTGLTVGERTVFLDVVPGESHWGVALWDKLWHPKVGIVYLHANLGEWVL